MESERISLIFVAIVVELSVFIRFGLIWVIAIGVPLLVIVLIGLGMYLIAIGILANSVLIGFEVVGGLILFRSGVLYPYEEFLV